MWIHSKYPGKKYKGTTRYIEIGEKLRPYVERVFILQLYSSTVFGSTKFHFQRPHNISFESWQAAKKAGWVKEK